MPLQSPRFIPLPLGSVRPLGWLERQLRIQAGGLSGHLDEFWLDIKDSRWFGGDAEGWERAPYWLDGVIPLAYLLDDPALKAKITRYMELILQNQTEEGWLGPVERNPFTGAAIIPAGFDLWATLLISKVLVQYHQVTGEERVLTALQKLLRCLDGLLDKRPLFNWGQSRWFEGLIAIYYLYERRNEAWLLDLAVKLQAQGFHWGDFYKRWICKGATPSGRWNYMSHVVNNAMAVKAHGLWWQLSGEEDDRRRVDDIYEKLDRYHGMVTGMFSGDECLAGKSPTQGSELCAVVEYAYSLELLLSIFGDARFGDRLEKVIFNALPATFSPDMWAHQYDQQVNQVACSIAERNWNTNGMDSNLYGLEPNYGCCTANLSQGFPKFTAHLWMTAPEGGLAVVAYAPSQVSTRIQGVPVSARLETEYPFRSDLCFTLEVERPLRFPLFLRIPAWAEGAALEIEGECFAPQPGEFFRLEREWKGTVSFKLTLPAKAELLRGQNGAVALQRGVLVYALSPREKWQQVNTDLPYRELPHADWEVHPTTPWNYALAVSEGDLDSQVSFVERPLGEMPFSPQGAPLEAHVQGRRLPAWGMQMNSAAAAPQSPLKSDQPLEELVLIPYGCTNIRITEFPQLVE
jgi:DUF1680 family protein